MITHCAGRFLIDLPPDFRQSVGSSAELVYGLGKDFRTVNVRVLTPDRTQPPFAEIVQKRMAELQKLDHLTSPSRNMLVGSRKVDDDAIFIHSYESPSMLDFQRIELFARRGEAVGLFQDDVYKGELPESIERGLLRVLHGVKPITAEAPSSARGTCLSPLLLDAGQDGEVVRVAFKAERWPDVVMQLQMNSMTAESDGGLLKRWNRNASMLNKLDFKSVMLRSGKVSIGGLQSEELLHKGEERGFVVRRFAGETSLSKPATLMAPLITVSMSMGGQLESGEYRTASWSDEEAVALWDAILKSIRPRPGAQ